MECCSPGNITLEDITAEAACPKCGSRGRGVKVRTIKHWIVTDLVPGLPELPFYFCEKEKCPIVYFSGDGSARYTKDEVRYSVGLKDGKGSATLCYCFGVTVEMISKEAGETGGSTFSKWIAKEVKQGNCACEVRNPSGKCCLKDVKKVEEMYTCKEVRKGET